MKFLSALSAFAASIFVGPSVADQAPHNTLPPLLVSQCQQRVQQVNNLTYDWDVVRQEQIVPKQPQQLPQMQQKLRDGLITALHSRGVTDPAQVQEDVSQLIPKVTEQWKGASYSSVSTWKFVKQGEQTLVEGTKSIGSSSLKYVQLYSGNDCIVVNSEALFSSQATRTENPFVWSGAGNAVTYRCPLVGRSLDLSPAHFVTLMDMNPLAMFGAHWTFVATTDKDWVLEAKVNEGILSPCTVLLLLSRSHNAAPDEIKISGLGYTETIDALSYRSYNGSWLCDKAVYSKVLPGIDVVKQTFSLKAVEASGPITLQMASSRPVEDYRLLGPDFVDPKQFLPTLTKEQVSEVVYYVWDGKFPTLDQLRKIYQQQHPGEATPDPDDKTSMLPTVGGLLCLVSGVLMYRRRDKGAA